MNVDVVIPTKSNLKGLQHCVDMLSVMPEVESIIIVADGDDAFEKVTKDIKASFKVLYFKVPLGKGIHAMWNIGLDVGRVGNHILFLNDDVTINHSTVLGMLYTLDNYPELGLVCPNYDGRSLDEPYFEVVTTCGGNYVGGGGLGGFCMMLARDLKFSWTFDEKMKWWFGDDDLVAWVRRVKKRKVAICRDSTCSDNESWTITNDPPPNFYNEVMSDQDIFYKKWSTYEDQN